jgi:hypothetical protein
MCPLCASTLAWIAFGGASAAGIGALILRGKGKRNGDDRNPPSDGDA